MRVLADTNVLLRFLVQDHPEHSPQATAMFERAAEGLLQLLVPTFILAECVFTLQSFYKINRAEIASGLDAMLNLPVVRLVDGDLVRQALRLYGAHNMDFADALLAAMGVALTLPVATFDKDFKKLGVNVLPFEE